MATESEREGGKNIAYAILNSFVIYVSGKSPPRDDEWDAYMTFVEEGGMLDGVARSYLIVTDGGSPTISQQKVMHERIQRALDAAPRSLKAAIVTPSTFARGTGNALNNWSPIFKVFEPAQMADVYTYLGIPPAYRQEIETLVEALRATLRP